MPVTPTLGDLSIARSSNREFNSGGLPEQLPELVSGGSQEDDSEDAESEHLVGEQSVGCHHNGRVAAYGPRSAVDECGEPQRIHSADQVESSQREISDRPGSEHDR